jgi:uncharacterized membrane protein
MIITGLIMPIIKKINTSVGMIVSVILFSATYSINDGTLLFGLVKIPDVLYKTNYLAPIGIYNNSFYSADYFSILPWIFVFLFGAFLGKLAKDGKFPKWTYKKHSKMFAFVGRNSLWFYLGHQAVLYAIFYAVLEILVLYYKTKI